MGSAKDVTLTLPGTDMRWVFTNAAPSDDGDYADVNEYQMGMANVGKVMLNAKKELNDYAAEVEWDAHALQVIKELTSSVTTWDSASPPTAQDILKLYESGAAAATEGNILISWIDPDHIYLAKTFSIEDIQRVPPDYPDSYASMVEDRFYMRPDGTYFRYGFYLPSPGSNPILGEVEMDFADLKFQTNPGTSWQDLLPDWIDAISARKAELTEISQTQMAYLQDRSEMYDRLIALMTALIEALKKIASNLTK